MLNYSLPSMLGDLSEWTPISELPGARVLKGNPRHFGRLDVGDSDTDHMVGVWECTEGTFEWTEVGYELQTLVEGRMRLIEADGTTHNLAAGDTFFTRQGDRMTWDIIEKVKKILFTFNSASEYAAAFGRIDGGERTLRV